MTDKRALHPVDVAISDTTIYVRLHGGRVLTTPLSDHPWLERATPKQRANYKVYPFSILWDELDEGIDVEWLLQNQPEPAP